MEYFLDKFSVIKTEIKAREIKKKEDLKKLKTLERSDNSLNINNISQLVDQGFSIEQIIFVTKEFQINSISAAILIMTKDTLTGKYNHKYYPDEFQQKCKVCFDNDKESHLIYTIEKKIEKQDSNQFRNSMKNKKTPLNGEFNVLNNDGSNFSSFNSKSNHLELLGGSPLKINNDRRAKDPELDSPEKKESQRNLFKKITYIKSSDLGLNLDFDDPLLCEICWDERYDISANNRGCKHKFCKTCLTSYLRNKIENGNVLNIKCLYGGCPSLFTDNDVSQYTSSEVFKKYKKFKYEQLKLNDKTSKYVYCPFADCGCLVRVANFFDDSEINCERGHSFCGKCLKQVHPDETCVEANKNILDNIRNTIKEKGANYNLCPNCHVIIEKDEGCNHMECTYCLHEFCWLCLKPYEKGHYSVFNFAGCPGLEFSKFIYFY